MNEPVERAMVLAAGLGTRMRPLTDIRPKPLVDVAGKTLLDHALDNLVAADIREVAVNVHYLPEQIERHLATRDDLSVAISDERAELLDSGGGVKQAVAEFPPGPIYILNADSFWIDAGRSTLVAMRERFDPAVSDMLLLVARKDDAVGFGGKGDFFMDDEGRMTRRGDADRAPYVYAGAILCSSALFAAIEEAKFSLNLLFDRAIAQGRLHGFVLDGLWLHVGTPDAVGEAERAIARYRADAA